MLKNCSYVHYVFIVTFYLNIVHHSPDAFQKQASILFGIALKEDEIDGMKKDLKQISEYKDLVRHIPSVILIDCSMFYERVY